MEAPKLQPYPVCRYCYADYLVYYAYCSTPVEDYLESVHATVVTTVESNKNVPSVLALACGDIRSCFFTLWKNFTPGEARFDGVRFVLNDKSAAILARNLVLLYLTLKMPASERRDSVAVKGWLAAIWAIWFCQELRPKHKLALQRALRDLIHWSASFDQWSSKANPLGKIVAFASRDTMVAVRDKWKMWHSGEIQVGSVRDMKLKRNVHRFGPLSIEELKCWSTSFVSSVHEMEEGAVIKSHSCPQYEAMKKEMQAFFVHDTPFVEEILEIEDDVVETSINYTLFERSDGTYSLNHLAVPFESFILNFAYSKAELSKIGIDSYTLSSLLVEDKYFEHSPFLANSLQQFMLWLSTSADVLNGKLGPFQVSFIIQCSDAVMFCQQMSCDPDFASIATGGLGPKFDVIHSSNLMDHTSPPGLVLTAAPLLKQNAFLFTTVLLYRYVALNGNKYLQAMFGFEPELLPLICGLRCIGCDGPFSDPVLLKPMPLNENHFVFDFFRNCTKQLVWQKVTNTPYMFPPPSKSSVFAKALCNAALLIPKFKPRPGITTERHLCTDSIICIIKSFASQMCSKACANDFQFWEGVSTLLRENPSLQNHLMHLQTQAHLNGLHIHLFEEHCAVCSDNPVSQYSITIKLAYVSHESVFNIFIHQEDIFDAAQLHHIVDSASGKVIGNNLTLRFFFPQKFAEMGFHVTVCCVRVSQSLHGFSSTMIMSGKLKDFTARKQSYIFQAKASAVSYHSDSPNFVLKEHCGDAKCFKTTLSVSSDLASDLKINKITTNHPALSKIEICCGKETATINFPYPVEYQKAKLKFSSSRKIIELSVPRKEYHFYNEDMLPFKATVGHKLTFPPVKFNPEKYRITFNSQFTKSERSLMSSRVDTKWPPQLYIKILLQNLFGTSFNSVALTSHAKGVIAYIVIHNVVNDLQNMMPILDLSFHILDQTSAMKVSRHWREMVREMEFGDCNINNDAVDLLCKVLNYFARHTLKPRKSTATHLLSKHKLDQYFTRAAVYLLQRDPDMVIEDTYKDVQTNPFSTGNPFGYSTDHVSNSPTTVGGASPVAMDSCACCGMKSMALKKCTSCKKVAYCNKNCQQKDWNKHKYNCTFVPKKRH